MSAMGTWLAWKRGRCSIPLKLSTFWLSCSACVHQHCHEMRLMNCIWNALPYLKGCQYFELFVLFIFMEVVALQILHLCILDVQSSVYVRLWHSRRYHPRCWLCCVITGCTVLALSLSNSSTSRVVHTKSPVCGWECVMGAGSWYISRKNLISWWWRMQCMSSPLPGYDIWRPRQDPSARTSTLSGGERERRHQHLHHRRPGHDERKLHLRYRPGYDEIKLHPGDLTINGSSRTWR